MRKLTIAAVFLLLCAEIQAGDVEIGGYFENQFNYFLLGGKSMMQDYNKLRVDLSSKPNDKVSFEGDFIFYTYHGVTEFNMLDFMPDSMAAPYESMRDLFAYSFENRIELDNACLTLDAGFAELRIGKQQLFWGTGYVWNPTDVVNTKSVLDPSYEKTGVNALNVEMVFMKEGALTGTFIPGKSWNDSTRILKVKEHVKGFDLSAMFLLKNWKRVSESGETEEYRYMVGCDFSGQLLKCGIWGELAYNIVEVSNDFGELLLGVDYTFPGGLYFMTEYYRNGLGDRIKENYDVDDVLKVLSYEKKSLGRDNAVAGLMFPVTDLINASVYLIANINDTSFMINPWIVCSLEENSELIFSAGIPIGEEDTEYSSLGTAVFARVRVYF